MIKLTEKDKAERYNLIVGYFQKILIKRADDLHGEQIYYDGWKKTKYMDEVECAEDVTETFISDMDNIGFYEFAELMAHEVFGEPLSQNNQFYDNVYGD